VALPLDVGRSDTFAEFRTSLESVLAAKWGASTITGLVNNAGFGQMCMFEDMTEELLDRNYRVIFRGPYLLTKALLQLIEDGGVIVNTSSNSALASGLDAGYSAYGSMKGALMVLTRYLAKELSGRRIRVNSVAPGPTRTRIVDDAFAKYPEVIAPIVARTALGRLGEPDDLGDVIAFLLSDEARWITGQDIEVSGGFNL
jgi:NAD(P)-dependent dehydrogenase (short-subunit alcohol dehydrogenase family)